MKKTHKLGALGDVAAVVARAGSTTNAARQLGVNPSTVHRWIKSGKVPVPAWLAGRADPVVGAPSDQAPGEWAAWVRATFPLDQTGETLLELAASALQMARNEAPPLRLAAMARYQQLVKQLNLQDPAIQAGRSAPPAPRPPRTARLEGDPRAFLLAVK